MHYSRIHAKAAVTSSSTERLFSVSALPTSTVLPPTSEIAALGFPVSPPALPVMLASAVVTEVVEVSVLVCCGPFVGVTRLVAVIGTLTAAHTDTLVTPAGFAIDHRELTIAQAVSHAGGNSAIGGGLGVGCAFSIKLDKDVFESCALGLTVMVPRSVSVGAHVAAAGSRVSEDK